MGHRRWVKNRDPLVTAADPPQLTRTSIGQAVAKHTAKDRRESNDLKDLPTDHRYAGPIAGPALRIRSSGTPWLVNPMDQFCRHGLSEDAWGITWGIVFKDWVKTGLVMLIGPQGPSHGLVMLIGPQGPTHDHRYSWRWISP
jgi:hypothetical protein